MVCDDAPCTMHQTMSHEIQFSATDLNGFVAISASFLHRQLRRSMRPLPRPTVIDAHPFHPEFHIEFLRLNCATPATRYPQKLHRRVAHLCLRKQSPCNLKGGRPLPSDGEKCTVLSQLMSNTLNGVEKLTTCPVPSRTLVLRRATCPSWTSTLHTSSAVDGCHPSDDSHHWTEMVRI